MGRGVLKKIVLDSEKGYYCTLLCNTSLPTCGKQWQSCGLAQYAVQQEELLEAQRAAWFGGDGPRAAGAGRAAASACAARRQQRRCNGEEQESERCSTRQNTPNKAGTRTQHGR